MFCKLVLTRKGGIVVIFGRSSDCRIQEGLVAYEWSAMRCERYTRERSLFASFVYFSTLSFDSEKQELGINTVLHSSLKTDKISNDGYFWLLGRCNLRSRKEDMVSWRSEAGSNLRLAKGSKRLDLIYIPKNETQNRAIS